MKAGAQRYFILFAFLICLAGCTAVWRNFPNIDDYRLFPEREIHRSGDVNTFHKPAVPLDLPIGKWGLGKHTEEDRSTEDFFEKTGTVAFLVLRGDTLAYEWYAPQYEDSTRFTSFSMAKVYISVLTGIAIEEGFIDSVRQPVAAFLPEFKDDSLLQKINILHLLQMTSGLRSPEGFMPWSNASRLYYGKDVMKVVSKARAKNPPGTGWDYINLNTQLLGLILEKATGKPVATYLEEKIWQPLGMESDASWSLDHDGGHEKTFCCLNARARDYARFGLLVLKGGRWNDRQIIPEAWLHESMRNDTSEGSPQRYQYQWYTTAEEVDFYGEGLLGQFTYICPKTNTVIIRLGKKVHVGTPWYDMFRIIAGLDERPVKIEMEPSRLAQFTGSWTFGMSNWNDSSLYGKTANITVRKGDLEVNTNFGQHFYVSPANDSVFFEIRSGRRMKFRFDETGKANWMYWSRRGNAWELTRSVEPRIIP